MNVYWFPISIFSDCQLLDNSNDITSVDPFPLNIHLCHRIFRCEVPGNSDDFHCREFLIRHSPITSMVDCCSNSERDVMFSQNWKVDFNTVFPFFHSHTPQFLSCQFVIFHRSGVEWIRRDQPKKQNLMSFNIFSMANIHLKCTLEKNLYQRKSDTFKRHRNIYNIQQNDYNCINCVHCDDHFFTFISFSQFKYDLFHTSFLSREHMNPQLTCSQRQWLHSSVGRASHR